MAKEKESKVKTTAPITDGEEKKKALETALSQIEKQFGKGAVMKLGAERHHERGGHSHRQPLFGYRSGHRRRAQGAHHRNLRAGILR